jgi:sulfate transport system permease protein
MSARRKDPVLPWLLGGTGLYLAVILVLPLLALLQKALGQGWGPAWAAISTPRVAASLRLTFLCALGGAIAATLLGGLVAWVLVRYKFFGRRILDALIDLPFALPTAVAGITLTALLAPDGWLGRPLAGLGVKAAYAPLGIVIALVFVSLPLVVRTVQPVLQELDGDVEEAAACLGAGPWLTFRRILFPQFRGALFAGFTLAFARGLGEYGSVVFISGNLPFKTEIAPLLILTKLEEYDISGAAAIAVASLALSLALLLAFARLHRRLGPSSEEGVA